MRRFRMHERDYGTPNMRPLRCRLALFGGGRRRRGGRELPVRAGIALRESRLTELIE